MSEDAQQRESGGEPAGRGQGHGREPGQGRGPEEDRPGEVRDETSGPGTGPGSTIASGEALSASVPLAPSVHDRQTVTSLPAAPGTPWAPPAAQPQPQAPGAGAGPAGPGAGASAHDGAFGAPPPYATGSCGPFPAPAAWPASGPPVPGQPFPGPPFAPLPRTAQPCAAPPPAAAGEAVPPPPIAPDGPGRMPYGYPGAYGTAAPQAYYGGPPAYHGWGGAPLPANGAGTAALVLGIVSAAGFCLWPAAIVVGVLAVVFGGVGRARATRGEATNGGHALAGMICGAVGAVLAIAFGAFVLFT